jgi:hypothetical protein
MGKAKISTLISTPLGILIVFYTDGGCWQFRVIANYGSVYGLNKIYYTAEAAERAGREWVAARLSNEVIATDTNHESVSKPKRASISNSMIGKSTMERPRINSGEL